MTTELHPKAKAACRAHGLTDIITEEEETDLLAVAPGDWVSEEDGGTWARAGVCASKFATRPGWVAHRLPDGPEFHGVDCDAAVEALFAAEDAAKAQTDRDKIAAASYVVFGEVHFRVTATDPDVRVWCTHGDWYGTVVFSEAGALQGLRVDYTRREHPHTAFTVTAADTLNKYMAGLK